MLSWVLLRQAIHIMHSCAGASSFPVNLGVSPLDTLSTDTRIARCVPRLRHHG